MKNIILNLTPAMQATTGGIDPQRQIALEVCMAIKGEPGQAGGGRRAFKPDASAFINSSGDVYATVSVLGPPGEPVESIAPFTPAFDFLANRIGVFVRYAEEAAPGYDDRIVIYESDADGRPTGAPALSENIDAPQAGLRDAPISFSFQQDKLYWIGVRSSFSISGSSSAATGALCVNLVDGGANIYGSYFSLRRAVAVDNTDDYPPYSNDLLSGQEPIPVLMRIAG